MPQRFSHTKRRCEITIISFSRSICREGLAALIGVTEKPYPSCLSYHSHPIRPFRAPSPRGEGAIREYHLLKKGGEASTRALNLEPNESKVKRGCEEMRIHFFTAPLLIKAQITPKDPAQVIFPCFLSSLILKTNEPTRPERMEAVTIAAFAEVSSAGSEKESEARKIDIVKPMPARMLAPR